MSADEGRQTRAVSEIQNMSDDQLQQLHRTVRQEWKRRGLGKSGNETGGEAGEERTRRRKQRGE